ncbi:hypothetical protein F4803DRAFT_515237 [Xylaria telfairii]|nr:hypothetical protein F4803DRAFT_515237 [Xylaria telfairii]
MSESGSLFNRMKEGCKQSKFSNNPFLPHDAFEKLLTLETVGDELKNLETIKDGLKKLLRRHKSEHRINFIMEHGKKVFAILVYLGFLSKLPNLLGRYKFKDKYLPVFTSGSGVQSFNLLADDESLNGFKGWTDQELNQFATSQWLFLAPRFTSESVMEQPPNRCPLPFLTYNLIDSHYFSKIYHGSIQESHVDGSSMGTDVAVKELQRTPITSDQSYETEVEALEAARAIEHDHLVKFIGGFEIDRKQYLMFQWANSRTLKDFWNNQESLERSQKMILWVLQQAKGLTDGLNKLHNFDPERNCRHGDLRPENIIWSESPNSFGHLLITDLGLARIHVLATGLRNVPTHTIAGDIRYQPPEIQTTPHRKRSRSYDVWSMGCILLEFIIWLLSGKAGLESFQKNCNDSFYFMEKDDGLQPIVTDWIRYLKDKHLSGEACVSDALKDLLNYLHSDVLIKDVQLESCNSGSRATMKDLFSKLENIVSESKLFNETKATTASESDFPTGKLTQNAQGSIVGQPQIPNTSLKDEWDVINDNIFARNVFLPLTRASMCSDFPGNEYKKDGTSLCQSCSDKTKGIFSNKFTFSSTSATGCDLCRMLSEKLEGITNARTDETAKILRQGSFLVMSPQMERVWSIVVAPGWNDLPAYLHRGFPSLPNPETDTRMLLFRKWLDECDEHSCRNCKSHICHQNGGDGCPKKCSEWQSPKRLINVGDNSSKDVKLKLDCNPSTRVSDKYIALSHRWGKEETLVATEHNEEDLKQDIPLQKLAKNFQDAVLVTRSLGISYLWIDSICILQSTKRTEGREATEGDFRTESKLMEDYYRGAYCTIAASCSRGGPTDGFLKPRPSTGNGVRTSRAFKKSDSKFYICSAIDDFAGDMEKGELTHRGWVFQERALSRRTIHFTETQAYFECGDGIRCETMTKLYNRRASFLSDSDFPEMVREYYKGMQIEFFEHIYETYSALEFSHEEDRAVALYGLERRLVKSYGVKGRYGVLDGEFLHRSLLWRKAVAEGNPELKKIQFSRHEQVPSWSWMAVMGRIEYVQAPLGGMNWKGLETPFTKDLIKEGGVETQPVDNLWASIYDITDLTGNDIWWDREKPTDETEVKCAIVGEEKNRTDRKYVLILAQAENEYEYKRVGVAIRDDDVIRLSGEGRKVKIV